MSESITIFFILFAVIAIAAVIFCFWALISLVKGLARGVGYLFSPSMPRREALQRCERTACGQLNPGSAHYCRRCGNLLRPGPESRSARARVRGWSSVGV